MEDFNDSAEEIEQMHNYLIEKYGKKGLTFQLCRQKTFCFFQDPKNRKICRSAKDCLKKLSVEDGLIWVM